MAKKEKRGNKENHQSTLYNKPREVTKNPVAWTQDEKRRNLYGVRVVSEYKPAGRKPKDRLKKRWMNGVRSDLESLEATE